MRGWRVVGRAEAGEEGSGFQPVALNDSSGVQPVEEGSGFQPVASKESSGVQPMEEGPGFQPMALKARRRTTRVSEAK